MIGGALVLAAAWAGDEPPPPLATDRVWDVLEAPEGPQDHRDRLRAAGTALGDWTLQLAGIDLDGPALIVLADEAPDEPFVRVLRESLRRPVDPEDLLRLLDDMLRDAEERRGTTLFVHAGRARSAGVLLHPDDIYKDKPRRYGRKRTIAVDEPKPQESFPPAEDGAVLGPEWTMRFRNPSETDELLVALHEARPEQTFPSRLAALLVQLEAQGAEVYLTSTVRSRERGYLMWGAFALSRAATDEALEVALATVLDRNEAWGLDVPIQWSHPDGPAATREAARVMADTYDVVYATEKGARYSNHYAGDAADLVATGLPRSLSLLAPDGAQATFDLSGPEQARDLSLTPEVVAWVEEHFEVVKLRSDYPHWSDARR